MKTNDLKQNLFVTMGGLFHDARRLLDEKFKIYDLSRNEWLLLALLRMQPEGIEQSYAKTYIGVETSYFTKILNKLEQRDFIVRHVSPDNRRNRIITVNPKAPASLKKIFKAIHDLNASIQNDLSERQLQQLYKAFDLIDNQLQTHHKNTTEKSP